MCLFREWEIRARAGKQSALLQVSFPRREPDISSNWLDFCFESFLSRYLAQTPRNGVSVPTSNCAKMGSNRHTAIILSAWIMFAPFIYLWSIVSSLERHISKLFFHDFVFLFAILTVLTSSLFGLELSSNHSMRTSSAQYRAGITQCRKRRLTA